jgi:four helix bundle protein
MAMGSASELEYQLLLAKDLGMLNESTYAPVEASVIEVKRMLSSLILKLSADR